MHRKMWPKWTKTRGQIANISELLYEIDGDDRIQVTAFMRMCKEKWWKTVLNAIRSSKFSTLIRSRGYWIKWHCQNCSQTLGNCLFCACALKYGEKMILCQITKISVLIMGDRPRWKQRCTRFQIRTRNYAVSALHLCNENEPTRL